MKLRTRYTLLIFSLLMLSLMALAVSLVLLFDNASRKLTDLNERVIIEEFTSRMLSRSEVLAEQLAKNLARPLFNYDTNMLLQLAEVALANDDVASVRIFDLKNNFIGTNTNHLLVPMEQFDLDVLDTIGNNDSYRWEGFEHFLLVQPIALKNDVIGGVELTYSMVGVNQDIALMREQSEKQASENIIFFIKIGLLTTAIVLVVTTLFTYVIIQRLIRPIVQLVKFADDIGHGEYSYRLKLDRNDEIGTLANTMNEMVENLEDRSERIQHLAYHDHLTDLPNRLFFTELLEQRINTASSHVTGFALLFLDLDGFKKVNDTYGHDVGDELIASAAGRIQATVTGELKDRALLGNPVIARLGGDEFVLLAETHEPTEAAPLARALIENISRPYRIRSYDLYISASIGIATYPEDAKDGSSLMSRADIAMYSAKSAGKKDYHFFSAEMDKFAHQRVNLEHELRHAQDKNELELWYQPIVRLEDERIVGAEALIRWNNPKRGFISPADFIPIAEETGLIIPIGQWIIQSACNQVRDWQPHLPDDFHVAINISAIQIRQRTLVNTIRQAVVATGIDIDRLEVEVTETSLIDDQETSLKILGELREAGLKVWLDDFGTGYSSLSHLKQFPVTGVKIDRSFVSDIDKDSEDRALTYAVIAMADAMGLDVIAEGIETESQLTLLKNQACNLGQGFFISRPIPPGQFLNLIKP